MDIKVKFIYSIQRTKNVKSFRFSFEGSYDFISGQFVKVVFDQEEIGNKDLNKYLSLSCSPGKEYLEVTKKMSDSEFSSKLNDLKEGDEILFKGPMGKFVYDKGLGKVGFIIGGIGVTPVISILEYVKENGLDLDAVFLYSNWTPQDIAFKKELDGFKDKIPSLKIKHMLVECEDEEEDCFKGYIDDDFIVSQIKDYKERKIFILGPPGMVNAMKDICLDIGCKEENLVTESFVGY